MQDHVGGEHLGRDEGQADAGDVGEAQRPVAHQAGEGQIQPQAEQPADDLPGDERAQPVGMARGRKREGGADVEELVRGDDDKDDEDLQRAQTGDARLEGGRSAKGLAEPAHDRAHSRARRLRHRGGAAVRDAARAAILPITARRPGACRCARLGRDSQEGVMTVSRGRSVHGRQAVSPRAGHRLPGGGEWCAGRAGGHHRRARHRRPALAGLADRAPDGGPAGRLRRHRRARARRLGAEGKPRRGCGSQAPRAGDAGRRPQVPATSRAATPWMVVMPYPWLGSPFVKTAIEKVRSPLFRRAT